jgi:hypothetical protein
MAPRRPWPGCRVAPGSDLDTWQDYVSLHGLTAAADGTAWRVLRLDRLGGLNHQYAQVT